LKKSYNQNLSKTKTVKYIGNRDLIEDRRRMRSDLSSSSSHIPSSHIPSSAPQPSKTSSTHDTTSNPPPSSDDQNNKKNTNT